MAQEQAYDQPKITQEDAPAIQIHTNDELVPTSEYIRIGECNHQFRISLFECDHPIIPTILKNHPTYPMLSLSDCTTPMIYLQQFWRHVVFLTETKPKTIQRTIETQQITLTSEDLRMALNLPAAVHGNLTAYEQPPTVNQLKEFFMELGYDKDVDETHKFKVLLNFKRKCLPARWATLFSILNRCITGKETGMDIGTTSLYQIMYGIVKQCHFDYAKLLSIDVVDHVRRSDKKTNVCILFVKYFKILIG